jgi:hypothetical protein
MKLRDVFLALPLVAGLSILGAATASAQGIQLYASLFGGNETAGGDPDGYGAAAVTFHAHYGSFTICVGVVVDKIDTPTAAHIHQGIAGIAGPVVIPFPTIPTSGNPGSASFCTAITKDLFTLLRNSPSDFYVNVHTTAFPGGAIRGQLF